MISIVDKVRLAFADGNTHLLPLYRKMLYLGCNSRLRCLVLSGHTIQSIICATMSSCLLNMETSSDKRVEELLIDITNEYIRFFNLYTYHSVKEIQVGDAIAVRNDKKEKEFKGRFSAYNVFEINENELLCSVKSELSKLMDCNEKIKVSPKNFLFGVRPTGSCQLPDIKQYLFFY